jgi:hypothetical protein
MENWCCQPAKPAYENHTFSYQFLMALLATLAGKNVR